MGHSRKGFRDGSGPYKGSYQEQTAGVGRRQQAGEPCPAKTPKEPSRHGGFHDKRSKL